MNGSFPRGLLRAHRKLRERVERTCQACATHGCLDCDCA